MVCLPKNPIRAGGRMIMNRPVVAFLTQPLLAIR